MDRMIYLSMSGAKAMLQRQDVLTHNLANVSTAGFRAELAAFRAVPVQGDGASTRVYALESTNGYSEAPGLVESTGRALDVALNGKAMLAVQSLDGTEAYTRGGGLDLDAEGQLVTRSGFTTAACRKRRSRRSARARVPAPGCASIPIRRSSRSSTSTSKPSPSVCASCRS
jgi:flagellar basal-body rod protein FlgF